ncbi:MAG: hypothetical protein WAV30_01735 [Microgenomates group bacterium]
MIAQALLVFALLATLQLNLADYCISIPKTNSKTNIPCIVAEVKPPEDPPKTDYSFPYISTTYTSVNATASTTSTTTLPYLVRI